MKSSFSSILRSINLFLAAGYMLLLAGLWARANRTERKQAATTIDSTDGRAKLLDRLQSLQNRVSDVPFLRILDLDKDSNRRILKTILPGLLLNGALLIYFGQAMLPAAIESEEWLSWFYIAAGFLLFLTGAFSYSRKRFPEAAVRFLEAVSSWFGMTTLQLQLLIVSPFLSYAASRLAGFFPLMVKPWHAAAAWLAAIIVLFLSSLRFPLNPSGLRLPGREIAAVLGVFLLGAFLRIAFLDSIPWLLTGDEGSAGLSAVGFLTGDHNNLFNTGWFAFPSLYYFLQSIPIRILGNTTTALRLSSAIAGSLAVPVTYWAVRAGFSRKAALFASLYLAGFHFHIHFSRIGLNNIWDSFFFILAFGAAVRFSRNQGRFAAVLLGSAVGFCQYFYSSSKVLIILAAAWLAILALQRRGKAGEPDHSSRKLAAGIIMATLAFLVVIMPLGLFYLEHPTDLLAPFQRVKVIDTNDPLLSWPVLIETIPKMKDQLIISLKAFTATNLRMWYNSNQPMLLTLPAALFLAGLGVMLLNPGNPAIIWLVLWLLSAIGISMFSTDAPAPQRLPYTAPAVSIVIALSLHQVSAWLEEQWPKARRWIFGAAGLLIVFATAANIHYYFYDHAENREFGDLNTEVAFNAGKLLRDKPEDTLVYFLGGRMGYYSHSSIKYLAPQCRGEDLMNPITEPPPVQQYQETVFIILPERQEEIETLIEFFPRGEQRLHYSNNNDVLFITYTVPPSY